MEAEKALHIGLVKGGTVQRIGFVVLLFLAAAFIPITALCTETTAFAPNPPLGTPENIEFIMGTLGGFVGAPLGAWSAIAILHAILEAQGIMDSGLSSGIPGFLIGYPLGAMVGASFGVIGIGWVLHDDGDEALTFLGAAIGAGVGLAGLFFAPSLGLFGIPICAAAGATLGYNFERSPSSKPASFEAHYMNMMMQRVLAGDGAGNRTLNLAVMSRAL